MDTQSEFHHFALMLMRVTLVASFALAVTVKGVLASASFSLGGEKSGGGCAGLDCLNAPNILNKLSVLSAAPTNRTCATPVKEQSTRRKEPPPYTSTGVWKWHRSQSSPSRIWNCDGGKGASANRDPDSPGTFGIVPASRVADSDAEA